jgi:hypothetical protein
MKAKAFEAVFAEVDYSGATKKNITRDHLSNFWRRLEEHRDRCGVYVLADKSRRKWKPLYVGMTTITFRKRLNRHSDAGSFQRFLKGEKSKQFGFFLLTTPTSTGKGSRKQSVKKVQKAREALELAIEALEIACIKRCHDKNRALYNKLLLKEKFAIKRGKSMPNVDWLKFK